MRRIRFDRTYLRDFAALESGLTEKDRQTLDRIMAAVVANPSLPGRVPSFYDPDRPSWLARADPFVLHYMHDVDADEVVFLNLFQRR
ncbi:MAG: hypothetical protein ACREQQ_09360 [Candidatus Binatia bacterium]